MHIEPYLFFSQMAFLYIYNICLKLSIMQRFSCCSSLILFSFTLTFIKLYIYMLTQQLIHLIIYCIISQFNRINIDKISLKSNFPSIKWKKLWIRAEKISSFFLFSKASGGRQQSFQKKVSSNNSFFHDYC